MQGKLLSFARPPLAWAGGTLVKAFTPGIYTGSNLTFAPGDTTLTPVLHNQPRTAAASSAVRLRATGRLIDAASRGDPMNPSVQ